MFEVELFDNGADDKGYIGDVDLAVEPTVGMEVNGFRVVALLPTEQEGSDYRLLVDLLTDED